MSHLSLALKKYYASNGRRIIFNNGLSPAKMAIQMWEMLDYSQVDGSVISRVLSGSRLFTPAQLHVFGNIMNLTKSEVDSLHSALMKDYMSRDKFAPQMNGFAKKLNDYSNDLLVLCGELLVEGKYHELNILADIILKHIGESECEEDIVMLDNVQHDQLVWALFYYGISCGMTNIQEAQSKSDMIVEKLRIISNFTASPRHRAIYHLLSANAQYIRAEYQQLSASAAWTAHRLALQHATRAVEYCGLNDPIGLFSYRQMIIALSRLQKKQELEFLYTNLFSQLGCISSKQDVFALRLYRCAFNEMEKLGIAINSKHIEVVRRRFGNLLEKTILYQISDIRMQINCLTEKKAGLEDDSLMKLIDKGLELSSMHKYYRHYNSIRKYKAIIMH